MKKLYRLLSLMLVALLMLSAPAFAEIEECPTVEAGVRKIDQFGNIVLDISYDTLLNLGYNYGDMLTVDVGGHVIDMPLCLDYNNVDIGEYILCVAPPNTGNDDTPAVSINMGNIAVALGIAEKEKTEEAPGYVWHYTDAYKDGVAIRISLKEAGGYLEQLKLHELTISLKRSDYPDLTDEEYANFRCVKTTGMGANVLYRSASPVNPQYGRNHEADAAINAAGISTIINLGDSDLIIKGYEDYAYTYYSKVDVIGLDLAVDMENEHFQRPLADGLRFFASHEGPYLVHCTLGKDRTGFVCGVLECLMGASAEEVEEDYMVSYKNLYNAEPGSEIWEAVADGNIRSFLPKAFGIQSLQGVDLAAAAEAYLLKIGMTEDEISALKTRLGTDIK